MSAEPRAAANQPFDTDRVGTAAPRPRTSAARALAVVAATVFALFAALAMPLARFGDTTGPGWQLLESRPPAALVVLGDSRAHVALSPAALSVALHRGGPVLPMLNLAEDGTDVLHQALLLRDAVRRAHPPAVAVWVVGPQGFDGSRPSNRLERVSARALPWLVAAHAPLELCLDVAFGGLYPPYRHRPMVQEKVEGVTDRVGLVAARLEAKVGGLTFVPKVKGRRYEAQPDGWEPFVVTAEGPERFARGLAAYEVELDRLRLSSWHFALARFALREARAHGTAVVFLEMPVAPIYRERFGSGKATQEWRARMRTLAADEGVPFLSHAELYATAEPFGDPGHLTRSGAEGYMPFLAAELAKQPALLGALARW